MGDFEDRDLLAQLFPMSFAKHGCGQKKPLARGIAYEIEGQTGWPAWRVRAALDKYRSGPRYNDGMLRETHRINLDGSQAEEISTEERDAAKRRAKDWRAHFTRKKYSAKIADGHT